MRSLEEIARLATEFTATSPLNRVPEMGIAAIFDAPLVGLAAAGDPLFERLKDPEVITPRHLSPRQWLPAAETVIAYFLPFSQQIRVANRVAGEPAREWVYGRYEGQAFNEALGRHLVAAATADGLEAVCPTQDPRFNVVEKRSNWSERHVAYIAGLGTFGLSKSLITARGSAGRCGSVVISARIDPTPRPYQGVYDYCPWFAGQACGACLERCPSGAIRESGKDVIACRKYLDGIKERYKPRYGCGKCQTGTPCEDAIPV